MAEGIRGRGQTRGHVGLGSHLGQDGESFEDFE